MGYGYGYGYGMMYFDWTYILVIIGIVITMIASSKVKTTYAKFQKVRSHSGITAAQAAERILHGAGIYDVSIQHIAGNLTDNYDPRSRVLHLSDSTYQSTSVAAIGVAAHECGHAIQHANGYAPLRVRGAIVPVVNFGSVLSWPIILIGVFLSFNQTLINVGIILFSLTVLFHLITLPVEFDASARALRILGDSHLLYDDEVAGAKKVLTAAAMTYVAAAAASLLQLLRLLLLFGRRRN
ncbi:MAG: zinc metallopeptidase [Eubacterium sp.]|nr:zinc metallopeptidase [Eubacterium sp.]